MLSDLLRERFNPDMLGQLRMKTNARLADLTDEMALAADELDALFLAKTHFTKANAHFWRSGKLFNANGNTRRHAAERAKQRLRTIRFRLVWRRFVHWSRKYGS